MLKLLTLLTVLSITFASIKANSWWMDQPYSSSSEFNVNVEYEDNVTLTCNDSTVESGFLFAEWVRPDLTIMMNGDSEYFWTLDGLAGWSVEYEEMNLMFIQERHFGFYYCRLNHSMTGESKYVKKAVNYNGPYFGDLWEKYELNVIIGCSAAAGFLLICLVSFLVNHFFFDDGENVFEESFEENDVQMPMSEVGGSTMQNGTVIVDSNGVNGGYTVGVSSVSTAVDDATQL